MGRVVWALRDGAVFHVAENDLGDLDGQLAVGQSGRAIGLVHDLLQSAQYLLRL